MTIFSANVNNIIKLKMLFLQKKREIEQKKVATDFCLWKHIMLAVVLL